VAAFADAHYHIAKEFAADRTRTSVSRLDDGQRVDELAAMLDGTPSEHSRANAREIIQRATGWKQRRREDSASRMAGEAPDTEDQRSTAGDADARGTLQATLP
jgi:DNA repair protein RecN (Recombination protein N)